MSLRTAAAMQEDAVERMWTQSTNSEGVYRTTRKGQPDSGRGQWADCGKHDLQEAKKLERG